MTKAVFLDRDGIINIDTGHAHRPDQITFVEGIFELCQTLKTLGYKIVIITNQAGIAKGFYPEEQFHILMKWMDQEFLKRGITFDGLYYCPHHIEGKGKYKKACDRRKPEPGMILDAVRDLDLDLTQSLFIGDNISDMRAADHARVPHKILMCETAEKDAAHSDHKNLNIHPFTSHTAVAEWVRKIQD